MLNLISKEGNLVLQMFSGGGGGGHDLYSLEQSVTPPHPPHVHLLPPCVNNIIINTNSNKIYLNGSTTRKEHNYRKEKRGRNSS